MFQFPFLGAAIISARSIEFGYRVFRNYRKIRKQSLSETGLADSEKKPSTKSTLKRAVKMAWQEVWESTLGQHIFSVCKRAYRAVKSKLQKQNDESDPARSQTKQASVHSHPELRSDESRTEIASLGGNQSNQHTVGDMEPKSQTSTVTAESLPQSTYQSAEGVPILSNNNNEKRSFIKAHDEELDPRPERSSRSL